VRKEEGASRVNRRELLKTAGLGAAAWARGGSHHGGCVMRSPAGGDNATGHDTVLLTHEGNAETCRWSPSMNTQTRDKMLLTASALGLDRLVKLSL